MRAAAKARRRTANAAAIAVAAVTNVMLSLICFDYHKKRSFPRKDPIAQSVRRTEARED